MAVSDDALAVGTLHLSADVGGNRAHHVGECPLCRRIPDLLTYVGDQAHNAKNSGSTWSDVDYVTRSESLKKHESVSVCAAVSSLRL